MAAELQQALLEAGGSTSMCDLCRPSIQGHVPLLGLQEKNNQDPRNMVRNRLSDIIDAANQCWVCGWLLLLFRNRRAESFADIAPAGHERVWMGIERHLIHTFEKGRTHSDVFNDRRVLIRLAVYIDPRAIFKKFDHFLYLQQSSQHPMHLVDLLDQTHALEWPTHKPYEARIRPPEADLRLCRRWKEHCYEAHQGVCDKVELPKIPAIRLVDVRLRCIVHLPANVPWVALSYCWGGPQEHSLRRGNLADYGTPGALTEERLPPVLFDAMIATAALGERYVWIDSLCIVQDDELDKATCLSLMDAIYAHAVLTIVNAASGHASSGLPGIRKPVLRRVQQPFELNGVWLTEALDPANEIPDAGYLESCVWSSRGWTFQEGLLSRRCLVFAAEQIYWQCQKSTWCEGSFWERVDDLQIYRHFHGVNLFASFADPVIEDWAPLYLAIVKDYLKREFTSDSDVMHALTGVLRVLKRSTGEDHFWGLPISVLEHALTWTSSGFPSRRDSLHSYVAFDGRLLSCPFPSWSWIGWRSKTVDIPSPSATMGTLGLRFYRLDDKGNPTPLLETWPPPADNTTYDDTRQLTRYPLLATHPWLDTTRQAITQDDIPRFLASSPLAPSLLCFWTSVATLRIEQRGWNAYWNEPRIILSDPDGGVELAGRWASDGFAPRPEQELKREGGLNLPEYGKFVVVGATRQRMSHGGALTLTLVMVEMAAGAGEAGAAAEAAACVVGRRRYLVKEVMESQWESLQGSKKWQLVLLF